MNVSRKAVHTFCHTGPCPRIQSPRKQLARVAASPWMEGKYFEIPMDGRQRSRGFQGEGRDELMSRDQHRHCRKAGATAREIWRLSADFDLRFKFGQGGWSHPFGEDRSGQPQFPIQLQGRDGLLQRPQIRNHAIRAGAAAGPTEEAIRQSEDRSTPPPSAAGRQCIASAFS